MQVGDRVFGAFTTDYRGDIKGCCHEYEIGLMYGEKVVMVYAIMPDGSRASEEPGRASEWMTYFTDEREARLWLAEELRKLASNYVARCEAAAAEQEQKASSLARGVVTV